jgi:hypothetical protein
MRGLYDIANEEGVRGGYYYYSTGPAYIRGSMCISK